MFTTGTEVKIGQWISDGLWAASFFTSCNAERKSRIQERMQYPCPASFGDMEKYRMRKHDSHVMTIPMAEHLPYG